MRDIKDYNEDISSYELFTHLYWRVITRQITLLSELEDYLKNVPTGPKKDFAVKSAFRLLKEINWGFFSDLDPKTYPVLWKELTLPHRSYPFAGELKRSMSITDIFAAFVDIHGYTAFCQKAGSHTHMLQLLDSCIETDIRQICRNNHVMGNRARGDEIILVGTSAFDVINTVAMIADYFGDRKLTKDTEIVKKRSGQALKLPKMTVSAGIAGGKRYTVLVITAAGDLSGSVVNTAARLQSQANKIRGNENRILATQHVLSNYKKELSRRHGPVFDEDQMTFLDLGPVSFKGVELRLSEVVINPKEMYRRKYQDRFVTLVDALKSESWSETVFTTSVDLIVTAVKSMPPFEVPASEAQSGLLSLNNETLMRQALKAKDQFLKEKNYGAAVGTLGNLVDHLETVEDFDHAVITYTRMVVQRYREVTAAYDQHIAAYAEKNRELIMGLEESRKFESVKVASSVYDVMKTTMAGRIEAEKRKLLWMHLTKSLKSSLDRIPYLGK